MGSIPNVLVIESNRDIREFITLALSDEGYQISVVSDTDAALALIPKLDPDVILLDMFAPAGGSPMFMNSYHELPGPHAPVILLTTQTQPEQLAADVRADGYLSKPFHLNDLIDLVTRYTTCPQVRKHTTITTVEHPHQLL